MMDDGLRAKALAYLASHHVMSLATTGPDGVWSAAVFYVNDGFTLYFLSAQSTRHSQNAALQPAAAATIQEDYHEWRAIKGIQLEGRISLIEGAERAAAIVKYGLKFPLVGNLKQAPAAVVKAMSKISWYKMVPSRLYMIDNSLGLGHRDEIALPSQTDADEQRN